MQCPALAGTHIGDHSEVSEQIADSKTNSDAATRKCLFKLCEKESCQTPWHKPCVHASTRAVRRIWPLVVTIGLSELSIAIVFIVIVILYRFDYDKLYGTEDTRIISGSTFAGLIILALAGILLLLSLFLHKRRMMLFHILTSTLLGGYIFILSVLKIHFALLAIEKDPTVFAEQNKFLLSTACGLGILTLIASVAHFASNVTVFTYYNLRYIHPVMFNQS